MSWPHIQSLQLEKLSLTHTHRCIVSKGACGPNVHTRGGACGSLPEAEPGRLWRYTTPLEWSRAKFIHDVHSIGFLVDLDDSAQQLDNACGVVAGLAATRMQASNWRHAKLVFCADPCLNHFYRRLLRTGHDAWLTESDILCLHDSNMNCRPSFADSMGIYPRDVLL
jgi:hypothetical protein